MEEVQVAKAQRQITCARAMSENKLVLGLDLSDIARKIGIGELCVLCHK